MTDLKFPYDDLPALMASLLPPIPPSPTPFADLTLDGVLRCLAELPRIKPLTIVVTRYIYGVVSVEDATGRYILCDEQSIARVLELTDPDEAGREGVAGLVAYASIPVVYNDDLARRLLMDTLQKAS